MPFSRAPPRASRDHDEVELLGGSVSADLDRALVIGVERVEREARVDRGVRQHLVVTRDDLPAAQVHAERLAVRNEPLSHVARHRCGSASGTFCR